MKKPQVPLLFGKDMGDLQVVLNTTVGKVASLFGVGSNRWYNVTSENADEVLPSRYALLCRLLLTHPELYKSPVVSPAEVYEICSELSPGLTPRQFALLVGLEPTSGLRLVEVGNEGSAPGKKGITEPIRMMLIIMKEAFDAAKTHDEKKAVFEIFRKNAELEATARMIDLEEFWNHGGWNARAKHPAIKQTKRSPRKKG